MKYILVAVVSLIIFAGCAGNSVARGAGNSAVKSAVPGGSRIAAPDGVYEGTGHGYRGLIRVQVRLSGGRIAEIDIDDSMEDYFVGGEAMEELLDMVIAHNSTDIDAISGATESSRGFLEAVENAILSP